MTHENQSMHISQDPYSGIVTNDKTSIKTLFNTHSEHLICFGHHHPVHYYQTDDTVFLNPGALGCNDKPLARYAVVELKDRRWDIRLKNVPYDRESFLASYDALNVPDHKFLIEAFHGGI